MGLSAGAIAVWFHRLYGRLGLKGCSSHSGRRTFVTALAKSLASHGGSLRDVQQLAGQASLAMTQRYIEDTATPSAPRSRHGANVAWAADGFATRAQAAQEAFWWSLSGFWILATDSPLRERYRDHALVGRWKGYRECHIRPDLIYEPFRSPVRQWRPFGNGNQASQRVVMPGCMVPFVPILEEGQDPPAVRATPNEDR